MNSEVYIRIYEGQEQLEVKSFSGDQVVIGRNAEVDIDLENAEISPIHAMIEKRGTSFYICDLGSDKGTFKNGDKIIDVPLESGDEITLGPYRLEFYLGEAKPKTVPPVVAIPSAASNVGSKIPDRPSQMVPKGEKEETLSSDLISKKDLSEVFGPSRGAVVEVIVAWKDKVIATYHFNERKQVVLGGHGQCDIYLPIFGNRNIQHTLLDIGVQTTVLLSPNMTGEVSTETEKLAFADLMKSRRLEPKQAGYGLVLEQGEVIRADLPGEMVTLYIRHVNHTPKHLLSPVFAMNMPEMVSIATAIFISFFLSLYVSIKVPSENLKGLEELAKPRRAKIVYTQPVQPPVKKEKKVEKTKQLPVMTLVQKKKKKPKVRSAEKVVMRKKVGKTARVRPKNLPQAPKKVTSIRRGGKVKVSKKAGASAATKKKDISKIGILGVFGNQGIRDQISKTSSGVGVLQGLAERATGGIGENENVPGQGIGSELRDTGRGGQGTSTVGIETVNTKGRGSGTVGYGRGGVGRKRSIEVKLSDDEADFIGSIDREAIRRVVLAHIREVRACYESQLNRQPDLEGKIVLQWAIGERGIVSRARVKRSAMQSPPVERCLIARLRTWRFPEPPEGMLAEVSYPFLFAAQN